MRNKCLIICLGVLLLSSCETIPSLVKSTAYKGIYTEKPLAILLMPPINRSVNVEAKEYFHSTLNRPIAEAGYYIIPPFLSMEILKRESAYDAELFIDAPLTKFGDVFGADLALFTIIHTWSKNTLNSEVYIDVEYLFKSIRTNEIVFARRGQVTYDASVSNGNNGLIGLLADVVSTAVTDYVEVARKCNNYTLGDLPAGKYKPEYGLDGDQSAGLKNFSVRLK